MEITAKTVEYIADLARLELSTDETMNLVKEMGAIIGYFEKLNELDTKDIVPREHIKSIKNVFREDIVKPSFSREEILANAPLSEDGGFKVPTIVE